ncbi:MAG TPA: hypothetical protein PK995_08005 [Bacteroidia bacterium]|nr:hypothetical protein [Bacteroidia bacterium]
MKIKNKILSYFLLIIFTAISFYFFGVLFAIIYSSRLEGIAWGFYFGIFSGQVILSIYQKEKIIDAIIKSIIYTFLVLGCLFVIGKYLIPKFQLNGWIVFMLLIIFSSEISSFIIKVLIHISRKNSNED